MSHRISKALGYGILFSDHLSKKEALTESFNKLLTEDRYEPGIPLQRYLKWMMTEENESRKQYEDTFVMDSLTSESKEASQFSLRDIMDIVEAAPYRMNDGTVSHGGVGLLFRPLQVVESRDWFRSDDILDYYSNPEVQVSWVESDYSFYPYDNNRRVDRHSGEPVDVETYEFVHAKREGNDLAQYPGWEDSVPATPEVLKELLSALDVFKDESTVLIPVVATWWE